MAKTKWATVTGHKNIGDNVHRIDCRSDEPLNHTSGNYVILRSSIVNPDKPDDVIKKAYSISSAPDEEDPLNFHFTIIDIGLMSHWLSCRTKGDRLEFSGPWGKKFREQPDDTASLIHLFATGTGFSPIGAMAVERIKQTNTKVCVWWQSDHIYDQPTLEQLKKHVNFTVRTGANIVSEVPADKDALYFMAGDGSIISPLCNRLLTEGVHLDSIRTEYFFNKPLKA
jgi:NAD(P)H-flavin reductase